VCRMSLRQCGDACAPKSGSLEGSQVCCTRKHGSKRVTKPVRPNGSCGMSTQVTDKSFACVAHHFCDLNPCRPSIAFLLLCPQRKCCVVSPCWVKKNDVAKMRQVGPAPATSATAQCRFSMWCSVTRKRCIINSKISIIRVNYSQR